MNPEKLRAQWAKADRERDQGLTAPPEIARQDNLSYGPYGVWSRLDVYRRKDARGLQPVIVSVHGGGFFYGTKEVYQFYCMSLAKRGFTVVNFNYRLAPEWTYPTPLEDISLVMDWILRHGPDYGMDVRNLFLVGDSAGGQLASQYALLRSNPRYAGLFSFPVSPAPIRAVALNCGLYTIDESFLSDEIPRRWYFGADVLRRFPEQLPMGRHITGDYPPAFVMSCPGDFLLPMAAPMAELLASRGVETVLRICESRDEELGHVFHVNQKLRAADLCNGEECNFFLAHMQKN